MTNKEAIQHLIPPTTISNGGGDCPVNKHWIAYKMAIKALEEQKTGHWINKSHQSGCGIYFIDYRCSECDDSNDEETKFCPNCGAKMIDVEEQTSMEQDYTNYILDREMESK